MLRFTSGEEFQTGAILGGSMTIRGVLRESMEIHFTGNCTYEQLNRLFVDGVQFSVVETVVNGEVIENVYSKFEYVMCGPITDNRDGTFVVSMGTMTENEQLASENAELLLALLGGIE